MLSALDSASGGMSSPQGMDALQRLLWEKVDLEFDSEKKTLQTHWTYWSRSRVLLHALITGIFLLAASPSQSMIHSLLALALAQLVPLSLALYECAGFTREIAAQGFVPAERN